MIGAAILCFLCINSILLSIISIKKSNRALKAQKENKKLQDALVTLVGLDGEIHQSLKVLQDPSINNTPCGTLCKWSYWRNKDGNWRCGANRGKSVNESRKEFLDSNNQCTMFKFDETANERYLNWGDVSKAASLPKTKERKSIVGQVIQEELEKSLSLPKL